MARIARIVAPGVAHHITQRGNRRQKVFFLAEDYEYYLTLLADWTKRFGLSVVSYCLMPNHIHMIVVPPTAESLAKPIREIHQRYTRFINFREKWRGHLWQGRFASFPLCEQHLHHAVRYVEMNPVRAGLAAIPEEWKWSSYTERLHPTHSAVLDHDYVQRHELAHSHQIPHVDADLFRQHERTGKPFGDETFIGKLEQLCNCSLAPKKRGPKPKKQPEP